MVNVLKSVLIIAFCLTTTKKRSINDQIAVIRDTPVTARRIFKIRGTGLTYNCPEKVNSLLSPASFFSVIFFFSVICRLYS